jgi:hypothetical protein
MVCHLLSGGMPRDLIRTARRIVDLAGTHVTTIEDLYWTLAAEEMQRAERAAATVGQRLAPAVGRPPLLEWLSDRP